MLCLGALQYAWRSRIPASGTRTRVYLGLSATSETQCVVFEICFLVEV